MKRRIITLIKFIILVIVFYALLVFNVFHIGEKLAPQTKDYLEINTPQIDQDIEDIYSEANIEPQTGHFAAETQSSLDSLCESIGICDKIDFKGSFTDTEKYRYTKVVGKIVQFVEDHGNKDRDIKEVIVDIEINKDNGNRRGYATRDTIIFNI